MQTQRRVRDDKSPAYHVVQQEFAEDVVSIPVFQRVEIDAWRSNVSGIRTDATEYTTANLQDWILSDGGDTIVIGLTQEPDSMWGLIATLSAQRLVERGGHWRLVHSVQLRFPARFAKAAVYLGKRFRKKESITVREGDTIYDAYGYRTQLESGVVFIDGAGDEVTYAGQGAVNMKQLTVKYVLTPFT
ncbi:MAG: hypothetical protein V9G20_18545 [Candidatus Promineifilaceae bacterium]